ncbi:MAG: hypothetical protein HY435_01165 [Candidatus Liptonbacteria bacterium]|nr:hypothetical protein [Candidatus Liptonbacteria bacterium]
MEIEGSRVRAALWFGGMVVLAILIGGVIAASSGSATQFLTGFLGWMFTATIIWAATKGR